MSDDPSKPRVLHDLRELAFPAPPKETRTQQPVREVPPRKVTESPTTISGGDPHNPNAHRSDTKVAGLESELTRVKKALADNEAWNRKLKEDSKALLQKNQDAIAQLERVRSELQREERRLEEVRAEANHIASVTPEASLRKIDQDMEAAAALLESARVETERMRKEAETNIANERAELSTREDGLRKKELELQQVRKRLGDELTTTQAERDTAIKRASSLQGQITKLKNEAEEMSEEQERLKDKLGSVARERQLAREELREAQEKLEESAKAIAKLTTANDRYSSRIAAAMGTFIAHSPLVSEWLMGLDGMGEGVDWTKLVVTLGSDPIQESCLDRILEDRDHEVAGVGHNKSGVMIIGREDWTMDDIQQQIEAREGDTLRIYSQEMAMIALLTGHDPFDAGDEVLREFGESHPALSRLMDDPFEWPSTGSRTYGDVVISADEWRPNSPLTAMGYHVGKSSNLTEAERRKTLETIFRGRLQFPPGFSESDKREWGIPSSSDRLHRIAAHIAQVIGRFSQQAYADYSVAVEEWRSDLAWLKRTFYRGTHRFRWPDVNM